MRTGTAIALLLGASLVTAAAVRATTNGVSGGVGSATTPKVTTPAAGATTPTLIVDPVAFAPWGNGAGQLGHLRRAEGDAEGPMSLAVGDDGSVWVLDQVNERVQIFDAVGAGGHTRVMPIPSRSAQDLAIDPRGGVVLLERFGDEPSLVFVDAAGSERGRVPLVGSGVTEGGAVTALLGAADGYWVEVEHRTLVRIATVRGEADPTRPTLDGRRTRTNGPVLHAEREPSGTAMVSVTSVPGGASAPTAGFFAHVAFSAPVRQLLALEGTASGEVFVAAQVGRDSTVAPFSMIDERLTVIALTRFGSERARVDLPPADRPEEQFRAFAIASSNFGGGGASTLHHLHIGEAGVTLQRIR